MNHFADWQEFWRMGGYAAFVWGAYGAAFILLNVQLASAWRKWRRLRKNLSKKYAQSA
jgi:heme exporter protein D